MIKLYLEVVMFIDVHAHLYSEKFEDVEKIIKNARRRGVNKIICCGSCIDTSKKSIEIANKFEEVFACVGVHPDDVRNFDDATEQELIKLSQNKKVVGIGEIGLDYYTSEVAKDKQKEAFVRQIKLANKLGLPIVIHSREATGDMIEIMKKNLGYCANGVVMHCFNKNPTVAKIFLDMGFYLSIGGCLTFPHSEKLKNSVKDTPMDRLLLETDCPYMAPVPLRGQVNEPANIPIVAEEIARIKGCEAREIELSTTKNAERIFRI